MIRSALILILILPAVVYAQVQARVLVDDAEKYLGNIQELSLFSKDQKLHVLKWASSVSCDEFLVGDGGISNLGQLRREKISSPLGTAVAWVDGSVIHTLDLTSGKEATCLFTPRNVEPRHASQSENHIIAVSDGGRIVQAYGTTWFHVMSSNTGCNIQTIDTKTGKILHSYDSNFSPYDKPRGFTEQYSPSGNTYVEFSVQERGSEVKINDTATGSNVLAIYVERVRVTSVSYVGEGDMMLIAGVIVRDSQTESQTEVSPWSSITGPRPVYGDIVQLWNLRENRLLKMATSNDAPHFDQASPAVRLFEGNIVVAACPNRVDFYDLDRNRLINTMDAVGVFGVKVTHDGRYLLCNNKIYVVEKRDLKDVKF